MRDVLGPGTLLGYCTNVHAGTNWEQFTSNLKQYAARVKQIVSPDSPMPIGLWLPAPTAHEMLRNETTHDLSELLDELGLVPFTLNGFPYSDFHQPIVKHAVYRPTWADPERLEYTLNLAGILHDLLEDAGQTEGSISTVPLGWPSDFAKPAARRQAIDNLRQACRELRRIYHETGFFIRLNIEPEPGCVIQTGQQLIELFESLMHGSFEDDVRNHLRVCHDVCHAAVMFEDQAEVLAKYRAAGIRIGKVQISNAIRVDLRGYSARERTEALAQLKQFSEDRYLHQTMIASNGKHQFFEDLPKALDQFGTTDRAGDEWRVHFHVPVYLEQFGLLKTSQSQIIECLIAIKPDDQVHHFEVETYAWNVLPAELKVADLSEGIAREMQWVLDLAPTLHAE
jgi:hypothetical protein